MGASDLVKICGLIKSPDDIAIAESLKWLDVVITNPLDVAEIDAYLKKTFLLNGRLIEERRTGMERRRIENNGQIDESAAERRAAGSQREAENSLFTGFRIDQRNKCVFLKDHKVDLTPKEFELVKLLSTDVDRIFKADEIISHLWPESDRATKSDLYQYMHLLRKKIEKDANNPQWIMNVKGFGYKLNSFLTE
jgi:DNA-binding response OmpR family regulator